MSQFDDIQTALRDERLQCLQDRRFYSLAGSQWEGPLWDQYENKPKFEVNKIMLAVIRVVNEYRNNRITVDFVSKDGVENDNREADNRTGARSIRRAWRRSGRPHRGTSRRTRRTRRHSSLSGLS